MHSSRRHRSGRLILYHDPDVLVLGGGPAALCIASELVRCGVAVEGIAPESVQTPWPNTYGIWAAELECLGLEQLLAHRWSDTVSYFGDGGRGDQDRATDHGIDYGLFDRAALQRHWLESAAGVSWHLDAAERVDPGLDGTTVHCRSGLQRKARLVIDASGSRTPHIRRPDQGPVAGQGYAVGSEPIETGRFVLMISALITSPSQRTSPHFSMLDLGDGFFVEETGAGACCSRCGVEATPSAASDRRGADHGGDPRGVCLFENLPLPTNPACSCSVGREHGASGIGLYGRRAAASGAGSGAGDR